MLAGSGAYAWHSEHERSRSLERRPTFAVNATKGFGQSQINASRQKKRTGSNLRLSRRVVVRHESGSTMIRRQADFGDFLACIPPLRRGMFSMSINYEPPCFRSIDSNGPSPDSNSPEPSRVSALVKSTALRCLRLRNAHSPRAEKADDQKASPG
jgi:hypothetical protein